MFCSARLCCTQRYQEMMIEMATSQLVRTCPYWCHLSSVTKLSGSLWLEEEVTLMNPTNQHNQSTNQPASQSTHPPTQPLIQPLTHPPIHPLTHPPNQPASRPNRQLTSRPANLCRCRRNVEYGDTVRYGGRQHCSSCSVYAAVTVRGSLSNYTALCM